MMDYNIRNGRTYMYYKETPLFPFGYGLSYSTFTYADLKFAAPFLPEDGQIKITFDVKNNGTMDGDEVVQLYIRYPESKVERPAIQLKGFNRVFIKAGETKNITMFLKASDLGYWDEKTGSFRTETGKIEILIGASSRDIRLKKSLDVVKRIIKN